MTSNFFQIALRQVRKERMYAVVKIGGFAMGIAACLLIAMYIRDELSFDKYYPDANRIFRVTGEYNLNGKLETGADWPAPLAKALKADFPEVQLVGRTMPHELFYCAGSNEIRRTDKTENNYEDKFSYADQSLLDIFQIPMVYGEGRRALAEPNKMVISRHISEKYFPGENPVGRTMILNDDKNKIYTIGGVMEDFPANSHMNFNFLLTMTGFMLWPGEQETWGASNYYTYILVKPHTDAIQLQKKLRLIMTKYYGPILRADGNTLADDIEKNAKLLLQPVGDIHLRSYAIDDGLIKGDIRFVWLFGSVACFILLIACINFINLSTAKSANRAKEVGIRKVVGSMRSSLVRQFLSESLVYSLVSFLLGMVIAALLLHYFNILSGKSLTIPWSSWWLFPLLLLSSCAIGLVAGIYPAFYLSGFKPIEVLKGKLSQGSRNSMLRNGLVIFQFTTSIILIVSTMVIYRQTHFILNKKLGYDKDQVMLIQGTGTLGGKTMAFKAELEKISAVKGVSICDYLPVLGTKRDGNTFVREGRAKLDVGVGAQKWQVDEDYIPTLGMKIVNGRNFSKEMPSDSAAVIINQTMASRLGFKKPLGELITNGWEHFRVIGVMEDFNFESMKQSIGPLCLVRGGHQATIISVKMNGSQISSIIPVIASVWKDFAPTQPIRFTFLDDNFANMYQDVQRMGQIFWTFAVLAIIIACLGLFALSAFMAEQRNKEIGIRKVLGASATSIAAMLSMNFTKLVLLSFCIATPIAWWAMNKWLLDFAYRVSISWWIFLVAGLVAIAIALLTVSFQAIKAAIANPISSLRTE